MLTLVILHNIAEILLKMALNTNLVTLSAYTTKVNHAFFCKGFGFMVFNATVNNISVISWQFL